jgi:5'-methylthioadenosine phosphorylase
MADPFCNDLRRTANRCINDLGIKFHDKGTYVCIEGPRFSTRSESKMFRDIYHADIIGMTLIPECILARESEICYLSISTITDYDVWAEQPVSSKDIIEILQKNADTTRTIISKLIPLISNDRNDCSCGSALDEALL